MPKGRTGPGMRWVFLYLRPQTVLITSIQTIIISTSARATPWKKVSVCQNLREMSLTILLVDEDGDSDGDGDITFRIETQAEDDADTPDLECSNPTSHIGAVTPSSTWATPFPVSPFFCLPTTESTLAPPTPSESGPSTPRSMPVLVYESDSYEDALFAELNAILDKKAADDTRSVE